MAKRAVEEPTDEERAPTRSEAALAAYAEEDDAATQFVAPPPSEPRWLVQLTPFDRRTMGTAELMAEVLDERLPRETRVWREGMRDWAPLGQLIDRPAPPPRRPSASRPVNARPQEVGGALAVATRSAALGGGSAFWLANAAVALAVAAATLGVLSAGGVFE